MITKCLKLINFGIFHDFNWNTELSDFKKYNLIYGWNRSGKTTISRVFASCEKKSTYNKDNFKQYPENGEFEITTDDRFTVNNTNVFNNVLPIKVFNQDFIDENLSFDPSDSCNPIIYVSEEDIKSKHRLEQLKLDKTNLQKTYEQAKKYKLAKEETKNTFLTGLGREVANILFDKTYNKTKIESKIKAIGIDNLSKHILSDEDYIKYELISKCEVVNKLSDITKLPITNFNSLFAQVSAVLNKKVISELLQRLKDPEDIDGGLDEELSTWVKQGFDIHKAKNQYKKCLFCENELDSNLFDTLSKHFSKDYDNLQSAIEFLIEILKKEKLSTIQGKNVDLYSDLRNAYEVKATKYNELVKKQNDWLWHSEVLLEQKYKNPFDPDIPAMFNAPENYTELLNEIIGGLNKIIAMHNQRVQNHNTEVKDAREKLELHSIAVAIPEQGYNKMVEELNEADKIEKDTFEAVHKNNFDIAELEKLTSNINEAILTINKYLEQFFGRKELELALDSNNKGYTIKRDKKPAKNLSEGEKTAIAFSYFLVKVGEGDFNKSRGIIFIDDPISSFDSNFIYHCFSMITTNFSDVGQLFISTHNFQLFNLAKEWFTNKNNSTNKDNKKLRSENKPEKTIPCEFFMVENYNDEDIRKAKIVSLDKTLQNYKSEYHFLFAKLKQFSEKQDTLYEDFYTIGNMARRFFDIFADFKIPSTGDPKSKMDTLIKNINDPEEKISPIDAGKAYKLVNEFSHNSDPTSTIEHKNKIESKDAINILLNIVKESDPNHFKILEKNTI